MTSSKRSQNRLPHLPNAGRRRNGVTIVEVALVFPVILAFFMASIEFARLNMVRNSADNAAYEAAREGMLPGATPGKVRRAARRILRAAGVNRSNITVDPTVITDEVDRVTVTVRVNLRRNKWGFIDLTNGRIERSCTLSREHALEIP